MNPLPRAFAAGLALAAAVTLTWLERRRPLRRRVEAELPHAGRNLVFTALAGVTIQLAERPIVDRVSRVVVRRRWGLLQQLRLRPWLDAIVAVILLDYTLYVWHVLVHRSPLLWRAHAVHHVDRDLDATTALRFHFAELIASVPWRAGQIALIGVSPSSLSVWQTFVLLNILFHHSNVELPISVERLVNRVIVTPRMHGIHHSRSAVEVNSNWSSGLTIWDRLHGTLSLNVPQQSVEVGVPGFDDAAHVALGPMVALPFTSADVTPSPDGGHRIASVPSNTMLP